MELPRKILSDGSEITGGVVWWSGGITTGYHGCGKHGWKYHIYPLVMTNIAMV